MMAWLRLHARGNAIVALFAIVLQIACTFGHNHFSERSAFAAYANPVSTGASHALHSKQIAGAATVVSDTKSSFPGGDSDALCPLCLAGHLAAVATAASAPQLAHPVVYARLSALITASHSVSFDIQTPFWSRGPPTT